MKKLLYVLAAVGLFAACQPEEIQTAFEVNPAKAVITVGFVDVNKPDVAVTSGVKLTADTGTVDGFTVTLLGNKALSATTVKLTATYKGYTTEMSVNVPELKAGGVSYINVNMIVGKPNVDKTIELVEGVPGDFILYGPYYFQPEGHELVFHEDMMWAKNLSEFILHGTVTYPNISGQEVKNLQIFDETLKNVVDVYVLALDSGVEQTIEEMEITVSAWSYYTAYALVGEVAIPFTVYADKGTKDEAVVATFDLVFTVSACEYEEIANPEGHGHYELGHGHAHDHGGSDNAGGGIVIPE